MIRGAVFAVGLVLLVGVQGQAFGQGSVQSTDVSRTPASGTLLGGRWAKMQGSIAELSTYIGSGTFYASGEFNRYGALALYLRPTYDLGTRFKLSVNARLFLVHELTQPDNPSADRFYPYDPWVWLAAQNLHTFERTKIRIGGTFRTIWPLSPESRYQHMLVGVGAGPNVNRRFEWGGGGDPTKQWSLTLTGGVIFTKYLQTSRFRGDFPGDTSGCTAPSTPPSGGASGGAPSASDADRCGGPANTNYAIQNAFVSSLGRGPWSLGVTLFIINSFKYGFPQDAFSPENGVNVGRTDSTWGIISLGYQIRPHLGVAAGLSSLQPALDARYRYPRFPFFDLSGGLNANNFTQLFLSVNGTL